MGLTFVDSYVAAQVNVFQITEAIKTCISRIKENKADAALQRWFGDSSPVFKKDMAKKIDKFRSILNLQEIGVGFETRKTRDKDTNASAFPASLTSFIPGTAGGDKDGFQVFLDLGFRQLPSYLPLKAGLVDASGYNQSKFETILHELSHAVFDTDDEDLANGDTAYGAENALALALESPDKAKNNAENWGIFIEACGFHKAS